MVILLSVSFAAAGQNPAANFISDVTSGCAPLTVKFTDQSSGNPTEWNWEFSNGTLSNVQNPIVTFSSPGTYSVKLVVRNANGLDEIEKIDYITVYPAPTADFTADNVFGCVPVTVNFSDLSSSPTGNIVQWEWDFGDGGTSTQQNPSHTYSNVGFYNVTLSVTASTGCKTTVSKTRFIRIVDGVSTDFNFSLSSTCLAPITATFQNQSSGPGNISYNWNFGNGNTSIIQNPSTVYNAPGNYTVTLNASSDLGCSGSVQKIITISNTTTDFIMPSSVCIGQPVSFQNNSSSSPNFSFWDFGDGTTSAQINPIKTFLIPGNYTVKLINQYTQCTDSTSKPITVVANPVADFMSNDSTYCNVPSNVQFTDLTIGAVAWQWDFGDGGTSTQQNPMHQYTNFGNYTVTLIASVGSGCMDTVIKTSFIQIQEPIISINVPAGGCAPFSYTPRAIIQTLDTIASYSWDLGEPGAIFNTKNPPPYTYTMPGNYTVSLTITTVSGCTKTVTIPNAVRVGVPPAVNFSAIPLSGCASTLFSFTDMSSTTPGALVQWQWNFGDGITSSEQNPTHVFSDTGLINVTLTVFNNGCAGSSTQQLHIMPPVAKFIHQFDCNTGLVSFSDQSIIDPALPVSYSWDFGDGGTSIQQNPSHTFLPGTYNVKLIVINGACVDSTIQSIVATNEIADFSINRNPVCKNETFTLTAINSSSANITLYSWTIGGNTITSSGPSVSYSIATSGTYDVSLTITDVNGCMNTKTISNYITVSGPTANFISASPGGCQDKQTVFTDLSTPAGNISSWQWDFGDGTQQTFTNPPFSHVYTQAGSYTVSLNVTDASGCSDIYTMPTSLLVTNPKAGFRADTFYCPVSPLQFIDTSSGVGLTYLWNFGDGNTSSLQNPQNTYPSGDADYTVRLKITDIAGCSDSVSKINYIKIRSPKAAFDIEDTSSICLPLKTNFTFQGTDYKSFYWDFGDGGTSTLPNPIYFYNSYGHYIPTLYVQGAGGCIDSAKASVSIYDPTTSIQINYGPTTTACNSLNVDFNLVIPPGFKFIFYFGDGSLDSTRRTSFSHFYSRPSYNTPVLVIYDSISGCQSTIVGSPRINVLGAIPLFGKDKKEFCDNGTVTFSNYTTKNEPIISTVWNFGDGTTSGLDEPVHNFTQPGTYIVTLNVTTQSNCSSSFSDTIYVYRTPIPTISGRDTICLQVAESYFGTILQSDTLTLWQWNFGNGQLSQLQNSTATYNNSGDYTIQLTATNKIGCNNTAVKNIYVVPPPTATPVQDPVTIISGGGADLLMNYTGNISTYTWIPATRLSCTNCPIPFANPQFTTGYRVHLEDIYGCKNFGDVTVNVICNNQNFFVPNTFSPNGDGVNEVFYPRGTGLFNIKSMRVFNRWGQVLFEKMNFAPNDISAGWNGKYKGQPASADVYIYTIEIQCDNNTVIPIKGNVTLLR